jgi:hypothetical protein
MARRARRATPRQIAAARAAAAKSLEAQFRKDLDKELARGIQSFAIRTMNSLAEKGPAWTGEFSASWGFAPAGRTPQTPGTTGKIYRYTKNDLPLREVLGYIENGINKFNIVNTSPHAGIATDQEDAMFRPPDNFPYPIKTPIQEGYGRPEDPHLRFQIGQTIPVGEDPNAFITAPPYWYQTYLKGGGLQQDLANGFTFGTERAF